jgi:hypothetical protein
MPHQLELQDIRESIKKKTDFCADTSDPRSIGKAHTDVLFLELRGSKSLPVVSAYREVLSNTSDELHEWVLVNVDLDKIAQAVGIPVIRRFLADERWVVRARAAAILFQEGELSRQGFLNILRVGAIPHIDDASVDRYKKYLRRRTLRVANQSLKKASD